MNITIPVCEVLPGDIWNKKKVVSVSPPPQNPQEWNWMIYFEGDEITSQPGNALWLVERNIERIEI